MKAAFIDKRLSPDTNNIIYTANTIIRQFLQQGYRMTLRQLYYQFIARDLLPKSWIDPSYNAKNGLPPDTKNTEKNYTRLGSIISDGRLCGLIDWDAIVDRGREAQEPFHYRDSSHVHETLTNIVKQLKFDRWEGQDTYVELWVEKDALAGVLEPLAEKHHVTLMVNKGYSSQSAMYESARRFRDGMGTEGERQEVGRGEDPWYLNESTRNGLLLYLGDHDPSGEDMVRDIKERLHMFGVHAARFEVMKIGLTTQQVRQFRPPPNPAKLSDPRAKAYIAQHGTRSWEVDALPPNILGGLVEGGILAVLNTAQLDEVLKQEEQARLPFVKALEGVDFS